MAAVGGPTGALVLAAVARDLDNLARGRIHDVDVVVAVWAAPTEGDHLTVRGPGGVDEIAFIGQVEFGGIGTVGVHHVELRNTAAVTDEHNALASLGIPRGRSTCGGGVRDALGTAAVGVDNE